MWHAMANLGDMRNNPPQIITTAKGVENTYVDAMQFLMRWADYGTSTWSIFVKLSKASLIELLDGLQALKGKHELIGNARGMGQMCCLVLVSDRAKKSAAANGFYKRCKTTSLT